MCVSEGGGYGLVPMEARRGILQLALQEVMKNPVWMQGT